MLLIPLQVETISSTCGKSTYMCPDIPNQIEADQNQSTHTDIPTCTHVPASPEFHGKWKPPPDLAKPPSTISSRRARPHKETANQQSAHLISTTCHPINVVYVFLHEMVHNVIDPVCSCIPSDSVHVVGRALVV